jgi:S-DNA-T family DNA segregation ATPase FtsK/SpoIIIE
MICQLAVLHSPEDVRIAAVVTHTSEAEWDWLKWLPHHQHPRLGDTLGPYRMTYRSLREASMGCRPPDDGQSPHVAIIVDDGQAAVIEQPFTARPRLQLRLDGDVRPDSMTRAEASACARRMARYRPGSKDAASTTSDWLELMGIGDPERIDPARQWGARQDRQRLRAPVGVSDRGEPVELDIKEAARNGMGPHGLCVGATGSGKSEFLRTLILGMIAVHPPEELNLVLVDFKGGATFLGKKSQVLHV